MMTYKLSGIHCRDCAEELEDKVRRLTYGDQVTIDYKTGIISVPQEMNMDELTKVLDADKLILEAPGEENFLDEAANHGHSLQSDLGTTSKMLLVFVLNLVFSLAEFIFGTIFQSSAILADAVHDLGDSLSIGLAFVFEKISTKEADSTYSYGYSRFSLLGAIVTASVLIFGSILMIIHALANLFNPPIPNEQGMFWMAVLAIVVNLFSAWLLSSNSSANERVLNLHVLEDALGWIAVLIVSVILRYTDWYFLDPLLSLVIALYILKQAIPEFMMGLRTFLNSTPDEISIDSLEATIASLEGVHKVTHLHVFSLDGEANVFNVTVFVDTDDGLEMDQIRQKIRQIIAPYHMVHYTIEVIPDPQGLLA